MLSREYLINKSREIIARIDSEECSDNPNLNLHSLNIRAQYIGLRLVRLEEADERPLDEQSLSDLDILISRTNQEIDEARQLDAAQEMDESEQTDSVLDIEEESQFSSIQVEIPQMHEEIVQNCCSVVYTTIAYMFSNLANAIHAVFGRTNSVMPIANMVDANDMIDQNYTMADVVFSEPIPAAVGFMDVNNLAYIPENGCGDIL